MNILQERFQPRGTLQTFLTRLIENLRVSARKRALGPRWESLAEMEFEIKNIEMIGKANKTSVSEFILLGFSDLPHLKFIISVTVFGIFMISALGNVGFLTLVCADYRLQKPMYFFLSNLSILDICNTSVTLYTLLDNLITGNKLITFSACMAQLYFFMAFTSTECSLLSTMAYDRYVAISNPLRYALIMNKRACALLASAAWTLGFLDVMPHLVLTSHFSFCNANEINHFFCDSEALVELSCSDRSSIETLIFAEGVYVGSIPLILTLTSYVYIISAILRIRSAEGRSKAFSTCSSHLTVVILFYGTTIFFYMRPTSVYSPTQDKLFCLLYMGLIPMLNPIIYSLRNKDVKRALKNFSDVVMIYIDEGEKIPFQNNVTKMTCRLHVTTCYGVKSDRKA
ncbi:olfactory receptor 1019-like [Rhinatrema bivittatum]|uniref:olfactory receptor 1019-like n=1 Tax=Rhinatrema bivittatum TaxID=194408 RepID=UPI00112DC63B|nr:olfactory receptor 1019-like [Rhinatrema bivittatum]